jgi:hypothetical protein
LNKPKNLSNSTPLIDAIKDNDIVLVKLLIYKEYADIEEVDDSNKTPLTYAILTNNLEIVKLLIKRGAVVDKSNHEGPIALNYALMRLKSNSQKDNKNMYEIIKLLLDNGAVATDKQLDYVKENKKILKLLRTPRKLGPLKHTRKYTSNKRIHEPHPPSVTPKNSDIADDIANELANDMAGLRRRNYALSAYYNSLRKERPAAKKGGKRTRHRKHRRTRNTKRR